MKNIEGLGARGGGLAILAAGIKKIFPTSYIVTTKGFMAVSAAVAPYIVKIGAIMGGPVGIAVAIVGTGAAVWMLGTTRMFY